MWSAAPQTTLWRGPRGEIRTRDGLFYSYLFCQGFRWPHMTGPFCVLVEILRCLMQLIFFFRMDPGSSKKKRGFDLIFYIELSIITGIYFNLAILRTRWVFLIIDYIFVLLFSPHMLILKFICKTVKSWKVLYGRYIIFLFFLLLSDYICKIAIVYYWLGKNYVIVAFLYKKENLP